MNGIRYEAREKSFVRVVYVRHTKGEGRGERDRTRADIHGARVGFANAHTVDVQELEGSARAATVINGKKCSGTFRSQVGEAKLACAGRGDLEVR